MSDKLHNENLRKNGRWGKKGVGAIIYDPFSKEFSLGLRSEYVLEPLTYGTIGGAIDTSEKEKKAIKREVFEELGINEVYGLQKLYTHKDKEKDFKYTTYILVLNKPLSEINVNLNWENICLKSKKLDYWKNNNRLHFGVKEIFEDENSLKKLTEWESFDMEKSEEKLNKNNKKIARMNREMAKINEEDSDIFLFINSVKSRSFTENNKIKSKLNKIKNSI